jgi:hypothetical protein
MNFLSGLFRSRDKPTDSGNGSGKKSSYSCNHCFSQIFICGDCGEMFRKIHWNNRGCKSIVWRCTSRLEATGLECHARTINELYLQEIVVIALNELLGDKSKYQQQLQQNIASVIRISAAITTDGINEKLMELQQELVKKTNNKKPTTRLPSRFLNSERNARKLPWTPSSAMNS